MASLEVPERRLLTLGEAAQVLNIGKTMLRQLVAVGEVETVRLGKRAVRVPAGAVDDYIGRLQQRRPTDRHAARPPRDEMRGAPGPHRRAPDPRGRLTPIGTEVLTDTDPGSVNPGPADQEVAPSHVHPMG